MIYEAVCEELGIEPDNEQMLQYYNEMYGEYPLDGVVDGLSDFEYSAEDDPYYDFVGHVFEGNDGSMLYLNEDGSFTWYQDDSNHDDNYYNGYYNPIGCKIYVPRNSVEAYKAASYWSDYASYIEGYDF